MVRSLLALVLAVSVLGAIAAASDSPVRLTPLIRTVDPPGAKCGDKLVASGDNLGKALVSSLYLTLGEDSIKVEIVKQSDTSITFVVPEKLKAGRMGLMVLTTRTPPQLIDQPAYLTIE